MTRDESRKLKVVFVGHVDHGKSTLIGRIFHDTGSLPDGKMEAIKRASEAEGMEFEFAFLLDALLEEQEQNITIDTTQIQFRTKKRAYVIIDAPGHKEFIKNMVTGAANAQAAVLLIDANEGVQEQSRRHGYLLSMLGINQVVVAVNKMDLVGYSQQRYNEIVREYTEFLGKLGVEPRHYIPVSAKLGDNIVSSSANLSWFAGPCITEALDQLDDPREESGDGVLRFPIQDVYRFDERRILVGQLQSGKLKVGDKLVFSPNLKESEVASFQHWNRDGVSEAQAGDSIAITLKEQIFVERGNIGSHHGSEPITTNRFQARIFWMAHQPLEQGQFYKVKLGTQEVDAELMTIERIIDATTLEAVTEKRSSIQRNDVAEVRLRTRTPLVMDNHEVVPTLGRFVIMAGKHVGGGGIISGEEYSRRREVRSANITWSEGKISKEARAHQNGHRGAVLWFTGLSGSGKSTLARAVERELFSRGMHVYVLDGDNVRHGLNSDLGFGADDRSENIRRIAEVAQLMADAGTITITAFISPYRSDRQRARSIAAQGGHDFIEVYVEAPLEVCEQRDPKNLYKKARAGEIKNFTGIDDPYEAPEAPEITVRTDQLSIDESVNVVMEDLRKRLKAD